MWLISPPKTPQGEGSPSSDTPSAHVEVADGAPTPSAPRPAGLMWIPRLTRALILAVIDEHAANLKFEQQHTYRRH